MHFFARRYDTNDSVRIDLADGRIARVARVARLAPGEERAGLPLERCLRRGRGRRQVGRRRWERLTDPPRVWIADQPPRHVLLVDDVWTTGATLEACAEALRGAGTRRIVALTLAHAL